MTTICGIEEAGRGPVIGPLVMAGVCIREKDEIKLLKLDVKDSKLLTPIQRERLYTQILPLVTHKVLIIQPKEIDEAVKSDILNLNWLEARKSADIINHLKPTKAILDCPSNNIKDYAAYVKKHLKVKTKIHGEHKADVKYTIVSAASIIAKVTRDRDIEKIKKKYKVDFGSGYPSDPKTKDFLEAYYNKYPFFRKSWISWKNAAKQRYQRRIGDY